MAPKSRAPSSRSTRAAETYHETDPRRYGIVLPNNANVKKRWDQLCRLKIRPTRYLCDNAMESLGIKNDVENLANRGGMLKVLTEKWPTYKGLTLEFLSTLEFEKDGNAITQINFRLGNEERTLSMEKLNDILGCFKDGYYNPPHFSPTSMWRLIAKVEYESSTDYVSGRSKTTAICNPVFRYLQRVLSYNFLARANVGSVRADELLVLYSMLTEEHMDVATYLSDQFVRQSILSSGIICIGGLITPIAAEFNVPVGDSLVSGSRLVDLTLLENNKMFRPGTLLRWKLKPDRLFPLPNPGLTAITDYRNRANWLMDSSAHMLLITIVRRPAKRRMQLTDDEDDDGDKDVDEDMADVVGSSSTQLSDFAALEERLIAHIDTQHDAILKQFEAFRKEMADRDKVLREWMERFPPPP